MNTQLLVGINGYMVKMMKMFGVPKVGEDSDNTAKVSLFCSFFSLHSAPKVYLYSFNGIVLRMPDVVTLYH